MWESPQTGSPAGLVGKELDAALDEYIARFSTEERAGQSPSAPPRQWRHDSLPEGAEWETRVQEYKRENRGGVQEGVEA